MGGGSRFPPEPNESATGSISGRTKREMDTSGFNQVQSPLQLIKRAGGAHNLLAVSAARHFKPDRRIPGIGRAGNRCACGKKRANITQVFMKAIFPCIVIMITRREEAMETEKMEGIQHAIWLYPPQYAMDRFNHGWLLLKSHSKSKPWLSKWLGWPYANLSFLRDHLTLITSTCPVGPAKEAVAGPISLEALSVGFRKTDFSAMPCTHGTSSPGDQLGPNPAGFSQSPELMVLPMVLGTWVHGGAGTVAALFVLIKGIILVMSFMNLTMLYGGRGLYFFFLILR